MYRPPASTAISASAERAAVDRRLASGAIGQNLVNTLAMLVAVASHAVLARLLGTSGYGAYALALSTLPPLALLANLGLDNTVLRFAASYKRTQLLARLRQLLRFADHFALRGSAVGIALAGIAWWTSSTWLSHRAIALGSAFAIAAILPFEALLNLRSAALSGCGAAVRARISDGLVRPLLALALTALVATASGSVDALAALLSLAAATAAALALSERWFIRLLQEPVATPVEPPDPAWLQTAIPMLGTGLLRLVGKSGDILILGVLLGVREAALYAAASRLASFVTFAQNSISGISAPMLAEHYWQGEFSLVERVMATSVRWAMLWAGLATGALALAGDRILGLWGDEFRAGWSILIVLAVGQLFNAAAGPVGLLLNMTGLEKTSTRILAVVVPGRLLTLPFAIAWGGTLGAAFAVAAWCGLQSYTTWRIAGRHLAKSAAANEPDR